ncbi:hypothetical protein EV284_4604 [Streptomyces sp. BK022]|uniref:hypothetical protein n=1 Tax=Streptomyces sp. BK022 TaxID=2512123 RepID=UPI0010E41068|nr:hypothetical protein [Streptomyces sp. BK022]RZU34999.1 hypothetical protein EV284_4604 [Streptomyces sp. BK022]
MAADGQGHVRMRTVFNRRSVYGGLLTAAVAGSLLLGAVGCSGDEDEDGLPEDYKVVAGTQLCGGHAISEDAAKALKVITGSSRFEASEEKYTVAQAATELVSVFPSTGVGREDACRIFTAIGTPNFQLRITWSLEDSAPTGAPASKFTVLKMGERTDAATEKAYVFFACRSDKVLGSSSAAHIAIGVEYWGMPKDPQDNVQALKNAYATVAHSYSLAMAKELRCDKNGGLPPKPVLDPA